MVSYIPDDQKTEPAMVAAAALDGLFTGRREVPADAWSRDAKAKLSTALQ